jgi:hypothetical protein
VERHLVAQVAAFGDADRVDLTDEVGDRDVRRCQLLGVAPVPREPVDRRVVAVLVHGGAARRADRRVGVVVQLAAADHGQPRVEKVDKKSGHPCLGLAALAEEHDVLTGHDRVLDRRDDRFLVADDARHDAAARGQPSQEVVAKLRLDGPAAPAGLAQLADRGSGGALRGDGVRHATSRSSGVRRPDVRRRAYDRPAGASNGRDGGY